MVSKHYCDGCAKEVSAKEELQELGFLTWETSTVGSTMWGAPNSYWAVDKRLGEFCAECKVRIEAFIKGLS